MSIPMQNALQVHHIYYLWIISDGSGYESCLKYELNYRQFANLTYEEAIMLKDKNLPVTECKKEWKFDSSVYQSTIVTEVCYQL